MQTLDRPSLTGTRILYAVGHVGCVVCDLVAALPGRPLPIGAIRVRELCSTTTFSAHRLQSTGFKAPPDLRELPGVAPAAARLLHTGQILLEFTHTFTLLHVAPDDQDRYSVPKVSFNYGTRTWGPAVYSLPRFENDYVILTPMDILTKDDTWISRSDMISQFRDVAESMANDQLRAHLNEYLARVLPETPKPKEYREAVARAVLHYPEFIDYYIQTKEEKAEEASSEAQERTELVRRVFVENASRLSRLVAQDLHEAVEPASSYGEALERVHYLKHVIEDNDGYRLFYVGNTPMRREKDLQTLFRLTWFKTIYDLNSEVNNGRGPVDYKISYGFADKSLVEFKLASNPKLRQNLENQVAVYKTANATKKAIKVILYFTKEDLDRVSQIIQEIDVEDEEAIVLIDARRDNKPSASNV